jgi:hypothetical protein
VFILVYLALNRIVEFIAEVIEFKTDFIQIMPKLCAVTLGASVMNAMGDGYLIWSILLLAFVVPVLLLKGTEFGEINKKKKHQDEENEEDNGGLTYSHSPIVIYYNKAMEWIDARVPKIDDLKSSNVKIREQKTHRMAIRLND